MSWNIRGLGGDEKCAMVRNIIKSSRFDVVLLQETKCNSMNVGNAMRFLPSFFNHETVFNLADNSSGGILISWKRGFHLVSAWSTRHTTTVMLIKQGYQQRVLITNVYGPSDGDPVRRAFIEELHAVAATVSEPWIIVGDFNLVRWLTDRSAARSSFHLMELFNDFVSESGLADNSLKNRKFTWTSRRPMPTFSKLDRVFTSTEWGEHYPIISLEALEILVSDHSPLLLTCKGVPHKKKQPRMETF